MFDIPTGSSHNARRYGPRSPISLLKSPRQNIHLSRWHHCMHGKTKAHSIGTNHTTDHHWKSYFALIPLPIPRLFIHARKRKDYQQSVGKLWVHTWTKWIKAYNSLTKQVKRLKNFSVQCYPSYISKRLKVRKLISLKPLECTGTEVLFCSAAFHSIKFPICLSFPRLLSSC